MIDLSSLHGSRFVVLGLARSGLAAARALQAAGVDFTAWDDGAARRDALAAEGVRIVNPATQDWSGVSGLVLSPGIPHSFPKPHPVTVAAKRAGVPLIGDIELLARSGSKARFVGITGTNGKSTTTSLIGHVLSTAGIACDVGGNLGPAALDFQPLDADGVYVLEMSSFQLELVPSLRFDVAIWLNITPDHIDRHGDLAGYITAKQHIFDNQRAADIAVIGVDDEASKAEAVRLAGTRKVIGITVKGNAPAGVAVANGVLRDASDGASADLRGMKTLTGAHNWQNAAAAWTACRALGLSPDAVTRGLATYPGLAHRQERVAVIGGIVYINDSKATNADATEQALAAYDTIYWIVGGTAKAEGIVPLAPWFSRVVHAFLVGASSDSFAATLQDKVPFTRSGDLKTALDQAHVMAQREHRRGAVVLLSPACASYDQWQSFEARGDAFRAMARALPGATIETGAAA